MCTSHADQILEYIESQEVGYKLHPSKIACIFSFGVSSIERLYEGFGQLGGLITGDFLLVEWRRGDQYRLPQGDDGAQTAQAGGQKDHINHHGVDQSLTTLLGRGPRGSVGVYLGRKKPADVYLKNIPSIDGKKSTISIDPELLEDLDDGFSVPTISLIVTLTFLPTFLRFSRKLTTSTCGKTFVKGSVDLDLLKRRRYMPTLSTTVNMLPGVEAQATYGAITGTMADGATRCPTLIFWTVKPSLIGRFNNIYKEEKESGFGTIPAKSAPAPPSVPTGCWRRQHHQVGHWQKLPGWQKTLSYNSAFGMG